MFLEEDEPFTDIEKRYLRIREKKFDYTNDDKDKGKAPESGSDEDGNNFAKTILKAMEYLAREIKEMRMDRIKEYPRIFHPGEISSMSHHWNDQPVNQPQAPQHSTMPTFLVVENEGPQEQASLEDDFEYCESQN